jgi:hypothetical protein
MRVKQETIFRGNINFVEFYSANEFDLVREVMETIEKEIGMSIENHSVTDFVAKRVRSKFEREHLCFNDFQDTTLKDIFISGVLEDDDLLETVRCDLANECK